MRRSSCTEQTPPVDRATTAASRRCNPVGTVPVSRATQFFTATVTPFKSSWFWRAFLHLALDLVVLRLHGGLLGAGHHLQLVRYTPHATHLACIGLCRPL